MDAVDVVRRLHEHRMWSNRSLADACRGLGDASLDQSFEMGLGTLRRTLTHLYAAEFVWLAALEGDPAPPPPASFAFDSLDDLFAAWASLDERWRGYLARLTTAMLDQPVRKTSTSSGAGQTHVTPRLDVLLHVCDHAAYTTAQAVNMMRHVGIEPLPDRMLITLSRRQAK